MPALRPARGRSSDRARFGAFLRPKERFARAFAWAALVRLPWERSVVIVSGRSVMEMAGDGGVEMMRRSGSQCFTAFHSNAQNLRGWTTSSQKQQT